MSQAESIVNSPLLFEHVVGVEVLVVVVPPNHIQSLVEVEHVVRERTDLRKVVVALHQVLLHVELEALLGAVGLVEAAEDEDALVAHGHAHGPGGHQH